MLVTAKDHEEFYLSKPGRMVRSVLRHEMRKIWPSVKGSKVLGYGFAYPFLDLFQPEAEIVIGAGRREMGVLSWPEKTKHSVCLAAGTALPFENAYFDNVILAHALEHASSIRALLQESWRVLRGNGRLMLVIPNRSGLWARAGWSPFGVGTPYSRAQIEGFLREEQFDVETVRPALYAFPSPNNMMINLGPSFERIGPYMMKALAGVYIIECTKRLYASAKPDGGSAVKVHQGRWVYVPRPTSNFTNPS